MAPPGVNTFNDMASGTFYAPFSTAVKCPSGSSIPLELYSILSDHDYVIKAQDSGVGYSWDISGGQSGFVDQESTGSGNYGDDTLNESSNYGDALLRSSNCADTMLSGKVTDIQKLPEESDDTDFLKDLEELDFGPGDLDPCCDVEMEDSFQEFIDSALEKSSSTFVCDSYAGDNIQQRNRETCIFLKQEFLATLDLRPAQVNVCRPELSPTFTSESTPRCILPDMNSPTYDRKDTPTFESVPTKRCSCFTYDTVSKAVYSTAQPNRQDCVRICASTLVTTNSDCTNCTTSKSISDRLTSPLFIDTSSNECSESFHALSEDSILVPLANDQLSNIDKDAYDVMKWLKINHASNRRHDTNNNLLHQRQDNKVSTFTDETSNQSHFVDLESFVDIEGFLNEDVDTNMSQHSPSDDFCHRTSLQPDLKKMDISRIPQLQLSFLEELPEHMWKDSKPMPSSSLLCEGFTQDSLTPTSSIPSLCSSPSWSSPRTDSHSPFGSMYSSMASNSEDLFEESSFKSQLALLKLFSEENAESLFSTDSMHSERFV